MPVALPTKEDVERLGASVQLRTAPNDPRFPNTNQTRNCWQKYVDWRMCLVRAASNGRGDATPGGDNNDDDHAAKACKGFLNEARILCPEAWIEAWDEQVDEGRFPARLGPN